LSKATEFETGGFQAVISAQATIQRFGRDPAGFTMK
jgi:hypothetical protein